MGWLSDLHLNFLEPPALRAFMRELAEADADIWLLGGDIAEAGTLAEHLETFDRCLRGATHFVLGNHDYYGSSLDRVGAQVRQIVEESRHLVWLTDTGPQVHKESFAIVGDDLWGDARLGNPLGTRVELNDFRLIDDLLGLPRETLVATLRALGTAAASRLAPKLEAAAAECSRVIVLTHVPPFKEATWHEGRISDDRYLPWFSCAAAGEVILEAARRHPRVSFLVLCGHTHGGGLCHPEQNVAVYTADAEYGAPRIQRIFEISPDRSRILSGDPS